LSDISLIKIKGSSEFNEERKGENMVTLSKEELELFRQAGILDETTGQQGAYSRGKKSC
jgi:hypothetical protein